MIEFKLSDWRTNASILGLIRILDHSNKPYRKNISSIEIERDVLEHFEEDYFSYFSDTYEKTLPWYRIVSYDEELTEHLGNTEDMTKEDLELLNKIIDECQKRFTQKQSSNYVKVYDLIDGAEGLEEKAKAIKKVNLRKKETVEDRLDEILEEMKKLKEIIDICKLDEAKKHMRAKGVIYSHINRSLDGVSFLNRNTKFTDVFEDYREYFISPLVEDLERETKARKPYECYSCGHSIDRIGDASSISMVKDTGFDEQKKSSYVWNHMSDILICPRCKFLYSMISAGFSHSNFEGLFINYSRNIDGLIKVNDDAMARLDRIVKGDNNRGVSYRTIVAAISRQHIDDLEYEENDIQIVRYKNEGYIFNILSRDTIGIIRNCKDDLEAIEKAFYIDNKEYISIYDLVLDRIFNNQNLFTLIHYLSVHRISKNSSISGNYNFYYISRMNNINYEILKGGMEMSKFDMKKQIYFSRLDGEELRVKYLTTGNENKISGISYRLLNALKTRNGEVFMHNILNAYMYLREPVPKNMTIVLEDEEKLGMMGYAFVAGLNGGVVEKKNKGEDNNEG